MNHSQQFVLHLPGSGCQPRGGGGKLSCPWGNIKKSLLLKKKGLCKSKVVQRWNQTNLSPVRDTRKTWAQDTTKVYYTALRSCKTASSRSTDTRLKGKRFSYLGRWFESCRGLRSLGSWEPAAVGCTEHSRLPTPLRWHRLLLYLDTTQKARIKL